MNDFRLTSSVRQPLFPWYFGVPYFSPGGYPQYGSGFLYTPSFQPFPLIPITPSFGGQLVGGFHGAHGFHGSHGFHGGGFHGYHGGGYSGGGHHGRSF
ncbi:hypothetical protein [Bacillus timonensis]|uniref:hypothetical protein n=1 Tax=Bacillus timonensis TaxID=1033734 RepID=UPI000287E4F3|nr:hypothetical protein [Bacillus timonensis]